MKVKILDQKGNMLGIMALAALPREGEYIRLCVDLQMQTCRVCSVEHIITMEGKAGRGGRHVVTIWVDGVGWAESTVEE